MMTINKKTEDYWIAKLQGRLKNKTLNIERVRWASSLGDPIAAKIFPNEPYKDIKYILLYVSERSFCIDAALYATQKLFEYYCKSFSYFAMAEECIRCAENFRHDPTFENKNKIDSICGKLSTHIWNEYTTKIRDGIGFWGFINKEKKIRNIAKLSQAETILKNIAMLRSIVNTPSMKFAIDMVVDIFYNFDYIYDIGSSRGYFVDFLMREPSQHGE